MKRESLVLVGLLSACSANVAAPPKITEDTAPRVQKTPVLKKRDDIREEIRAEMRRHDQLTDKLRQTLKEMPRYLNYCVTNSLEIDNCIADVNLRSKRYTSNPAYKSCNHIRAESNIETLKARKRCRRKKFIKLEDNQKLLHYYRDSNRCTEEMISCAQGLYFRRKFGVGNIQN